MDPAPLFDVLEIVSCTEKKVMLSGWLACEDRNKALELDCANGIGVGS